MIQAGLGKIELPVPPGVELVGYPNRVDRSIGTHEPLYARALVLESASARVALCSLDLCWITEDVAAATRKRLATRGAVPPTGLFVSATHTHSGPGDTDPTCWPDGLDALIEAAVLQARARLEPARLGAGWGMLHGLGLNRRRLEDPIDPAVFVIRVDSAHGRPLGIYYGHGCHAVVLGPDSRSVSGDWPAAASRVLETELGDGVVALFGQGGSGDVNPLTPQVLNRLAEGCVVTSTAAKRYYGPAEPLLQIGDRIGGSPDEAARIGTAVALEVLRVRRGITPQTVDDIWTRQLKLAPHTEAPPGGSPTRDQAARLDTIRRHVPRADRADPLEVMIVGIDGPDIILVGQPGEFFADTGVDLRRALRNAGVPNPFVVGYANGYRFYLPPRHAFPDGGYEIAWAWTLRLAETVQDDIRIQVLDAVRRHPHETYGAGRSIRRWRR